jgi:hypothetical protein
MAAAAAALAMDCPLTCGAVHRQGPRGGTLLSPLPRGSRQQADVERQRRAH